MKWRIFRAVFIFTLVLATVVSSTQAYFSSAALAAGNQVQTGTLSLALDSTRAHDLLANPMFGVIPDAYNVAVDIDGVSVPGQPFEAWTNVVPGGEFSYWVTFRNRGATPFIFRGTHEGSWTALPRAGTANLLDGNCPATASADSSLVWMKDAMVYNLTTCQTSNECLNLRNALVAIPGGGWIPKYYTSINTVVNPSDPTFYGSDDGTILGLQNTAFILNSHEFVIYKVTLKFSDNATGCYQGATYSYSLRGDALQQGGTFTP